MKEGFRRMFKLGVITDEITKDLRRAVEVAQELNLDCVELRNIGDKNVKDLTDADIRMVRDLVEAAGMEVVCIASPFFKCHLASEQEVREHLRFLPRLIEIAKALDTDLIRVFAFWTVGSLDEHWDAIVERLREAAGIAESEGAVLALENEHATYLGKGCEVRRAMEEVGSGSLRVTWDPGNAFCAGEVPYPDGYRAARDYMVHVHVKDAMRDPAAGRHRFVKIGAGEIDYEGQLRALLEDRYEGCVSLETHYKLPGDGEKSTRETLQGLREVLRRIQQ